MSVPQKDLDEWLQYSNNKRIHQGYMCCGRNPNTNTHPTVRSSLSYYKSIGYGFFLITKFVEISELLS